ncbi:hypothetical protein Ami103574_10920 [Aminipila butyrica]|uniref:Replication-relaxation n=1 Tax=Aminipila butyrica TaxID=433296 RepID=A0A858BUS0_9FIRM|nr:hypothetical protein [Aminipila butyrica]QIB69801.1 hypothetical protein Ami103574_10920 [Aminipila butyrica]
MADDTLSINQEDILKRIVGYGGYVTKEILALYRKDLTVDRCYRILVQLSDKNYIRPRPYFESFREPIVYQVTKKACRYYDRPEAYMRKVHKPYQVRRYLMRSHFFFAMAGQGKNITLFSSANRQKFLNEKGLTDYYLPKKINKGVETVQIEEFILDVPPYSKEHTVCLVYFDNQSYSIRPQLEKHFHKYGKMQKAGKCFIDFLIVTESDARARNFMAAYQEHFFKKISMIDIKTHSINRPYKATI